MESAGMEPQAQGTSSSKVVLTIIIIIVLAVIAYAMMRGGGAGDTAATTNATSSEAGVFSGNVFNLVARGGDWKCTWSSEQDGVALDGTVLVSGGKFKSTVAMSGEGLDVTAYALGDGQTVYSWTNLTTTGFKFPMQQAENPPATGTGVKGAPLVDEYTYNCDRWRADNSAFALPSGVTFSEATGIAQ